MTTRPSRLRASNLGPRREALARSCPAPPLAPAAGGPPPVLWPSTSSTSTRPAPPWSGERLRCSCLHRYLLHRSSACISWNSLATAAGISSPPSYADLSASCRSCCASRSLSPVKRAIDSAIRASLCRSSQALCTATSAPSPPSLARRSTIASSGVRPSSAPHSRAMEASRSRTEASICHSLMAA